MDNHSDDFNPLNSLRFYVTSSHPCGYFPDRSAVTLVFDPDTNPSYEVFSLLSQIGFRRSGHHVYRPHCGTCQDCIPIRIAVNDFKPNRSQRRAWNKNSNITVNSLPVEYRPEHYELFRRYITHRHFNGGMDSDNPKSYQQLLEADWCHTLLHEFRDGDELLAVSVTDLLEDGMSAVYTFYDPDKMSYSPGVYAILWHIHETQRRGQNYVYLGYWIPESPKMRYKSQYRPFEYFDGRKWQRQP
ncbi:MAG: arginyltransferase [Gammaproteobacteria bacterium]|nr:arginyltransferase [Gammaproteobacteria bacterium]MDH5652260.1 arginyltransferase [Gammaproteobacteria bacterium]